MTKFEQWRNKTFTVDYVIQMLHDASESNDFCEECPLKDALMCPIYQRGAPPVFPDSLCEEAIREWAKVPVRSERKAIVYVNIPSSTGMTTRRFNSRKEARDWINEGLRATEGAEQEHYIHLQLQLEDGKTVLDY